MNRGISNEKVLRQDISNESKIQHLNWFNPTNTNLHWNEHSYRTNYYKHVHNHNVKKKCTNTFF